MQPSIQKLIDNNHRWADEVTKKDPTYFSNLAKGQHPAYLFIGCSDSRVAANLLTGTHPGEMFVHRNIANQFMPQDLNCVAVVQYAVEALGVKDIIVCGHYGCGGVKAAVGSTYNGVVDHWLGELRSVYRVYEPELRQLDDKGLHERMVQLSVLHQVFQLSNDPTIRKAWDNKKELRLNGFVYDINNGKLKVVAEGIDTPARAMAVMPPPPAR